MKSTHRPAHRKMRRALAEALEQRTLFDSVPIALDPTFGYGGKTLDDEVSNGIGTVPTVDPKTGNVYDFGFSPVGNNGSQVVLQQYSSAGVLNTSFGHNGTVVNITQLGYPVGALVQSDGNILLAWEETDVTNGSFNLTMYTPDGAVDTSFGSGGTVVLTGNFFAGFDLFHQPVIAPNGDILVGGQANSSHSVILALTPAGIPDSAFGSSGIATGVYGEINALTIDPNGDLVAVGDSTAGGLLERFTSSGQLETSFGNDGATTFSAANSLLAIYAGSSDIAAFGQMQLNGVTTFQLVHFDTNGSIDTTFGSNESGYIQLPASLSELRGTFQSNGQLLLSGSTLNNAANVSSAALVRLNTDGSFDSGFGTAGYAQLGPIFTTSSPSGVFVQPDGKILLGSASQTSGLDFDPTRINVDGTPDTTFGPSGTAAGRPLFTTGETLVETSSGQTLVAGAVSVGGETGFYIRRYNPDGSLDTTFGSGDGFNGQNGYIFVQSIIPVTTQNPYPQSAVLALAIDSSGRIILAQTGGIERFTVTGDEDFSFGSDGVTVIASVQNMLLQSDGTILVTSGTNTISRLTPNGAFDNSFNHTGQVTVPTATVDPIAIQSDGKILIGGSVLYSFFLNGDPGDPYSFDVLSVVRLNTDGTIDPSFSAIANNPDMLVDGEGEYNPSFAQALAIQPNGTIVAAGASGDEQAAFGPNVPITVEFLPATGLLNPDFGNGGEAAFFFPGSNEDDFENGSVSSIVLQNDGSVDIAGTTRFDDRSNFSDESDFFVARYNFFGQLQDTVTTVFASPTFSNDPIDGILDATAGPNGTLIAVGSAPPLGMNNGFALARYIVQTLTQSALSGTALGTIGSYKNQGNSVANVFDGNLNTFFDAPTPSGSYAELDLGLPTLLTQLSYAPRAGFASRMVGGIFQASNTPDFSSGVVTLYTVTSAPVVGVLTTAVVNTAAAYRFVRYIGPANSYCNIAEAQFVGHQHLLAALLNGGLDITGTDAADKITVNFTVNQFQYDDTGKLTVTENGLSTVVDAADFSVVYINTMDGNDTVNVVGLETFTGDNTQYVPMADDVAVNSGSGNDTVSVSLTDSGFIDPNFYQANPPHTFVTAGDGNDSISVHGGSGATIVLGNGNNTIQTVPISDAMAVTMTVGNGNDTLTAGSGGEAQTVTMTVGSGEDRFINNGASNSVTVSTTAENFALPSGQAVIAGWVFLDSNGDGKYESGEPLEANTNVYLDNNNDGILDAGDIVTTTDVNGNYLFTGLIPANGQPQEFHVFAVPSLVATSEEQTLTLGKGDGASAVNIALSPTTAQRFSGNVIGTSGSYSNLGNNSAKAFDGNLATYFDAPTASGAWVGLDLGTARLISQISFAPRHGYSSRMVGGVFQACNNANFSSGVATLYTIESPPPDDSLTTVVLNNLSAFRYVRYLGPNGSYCNIAEAQFFSPVTKVTGAIIGSAGSYSNKGSTIARAFDGNFSTYYDAATASGDWVGIDLGTAQTISQVRYAPRAGLESRMIGGKIQASNTANFSTGVVTLYTILSAPNAGMLTVHSLNTAGPYRYYRYIGPTGSYCNIAELEFDN